MTIVIRRSNYRPEITSVTCEDKSEIVSSVRHKLTHCAEKLKADTLGEDVGLHLFECASGGTRPHAPVPTPKIRIAATLPPEQFLTSDPLRIIAVPNLQPRRLVVGRVAQSTFSHVNTDTPSLPLTRWLWTGLQTSTYRQSEQC